MWPLETCVVCNCRVLAQSSSLPAAAPGSSWAWTCPTPALNSVPTSTSVNAKWNFLKVPISFLIHFHCTQTSGSVKVRPLLKALKKPHQWNVQAHIAKSSSSPCSQCFEASTSWQASVSTQETRKLQVLSRCFYTTYTVRVRTVQRVVTLPFFSTRYVVL